METLALTQTAFSPVARPGSISIPQPTARESIRNRPVAEHKRALPQTTTHDLMVRQAFDDADMDAVYRLTHDAYLEQGYCEAQPDGRLIHYPHLDGIPQTTVLVAEENGEIVGTNSLTWDGPVGLHVDDDFKAECDRIRAEGCSLGGSWRIATKNSCRSAMTIIKSLIRETVRRFVVSGVETVVFTFNPRHERIYKRLLNMRTIARHNGTVQGLNNAPAVFMRCDVTKLPDMWLTTPNEIALREVARSKTKEKRQVVFRRS